MINNSKVVGSSPLSETASANTILSSLSILKKVFPSLSSKSNSCNTASELRKISFFVLYEIFDGKLNRKINGLLPVNLSIRLIMT